jgi:hypothetical protein
MDFIQIGAAPACEDCAQVGQPDYPERSRLECAVYKRMLERLNPVPAGIAARFTVRVFNHDFGPYREVVVEYQGQQGQEFALRVERESPEAWDDLARWELYWHERRAAYRAAVREGRIQAAEVPQAFVGQNPPAVPPESRFVELASTYR